MEISINKLTDLTVGQFLNQAEAWVRQTIQEEVKLATGNQEQYQVVDKNMSRDQAMNTIGVSGPTLQGLVTQGFLRAINIGGKLFFSIENINAYLEHGDQILDFYDPELNDKMI